MRANKIQNIFSYRIQQNTRPLVQGWNPRKCISTLCLTDTEGMFDGFSLTTVQVEQNSQFQDAFLGNNSVFKDIYLSCNVFILLYVTGVLESSSVIVTSSAYE